MMGPLQVLSLRFKVELGVMSMKVFAIELPNSSFIIRFSLVSYTGHRICLQI